MNQTSSPPAFMDDHTLLQPCLNCGAQMDISEQEPLARISCPVCDTLTLVSGQVDHYELQQVVGRGGMGVVYKALDTSLDRHVALKLLRRDKNRDAKLIAQLETEAAITASINHPYVVRVFTTGSDHGRFYIAMELVEKGTLDELIKLQKRVGEAQSLEVGIQIADGLRAAQQHGLIHRDVKPGNILFADAHTAKIVDFGLAIFMEDEAQVRGEIWGTPYYVAPEKLENLPEDFRSDIYSLGATLFHALAGRPPFEAKDASMVALKHLKNQAVSLQAFAPHVSGETAYVINRTLSKDPKERYQSYGELIEHLEYAREQLLQKANQPQVQRRVVLEDEQQQKFMGWITAAMVLLILGVGIAAFAFRSQLFPGAQDNSNSVAASKAPAKIYIPMTSAPPTPVPTATASAKATPVAAAAVAAVAGEPVADGIYRLVNEEFGRVLEVGDSSMEDGATLRVLPNKGTPNQQWHISPLGDGTYKLAALHSDKVLQLKGARQTNSTDVEQGTWSDSTSQKWQLEKLPTGLYRLLLQPSGRALALSPNRRVMIWMPGDVNNNNLWRLEPVRK